jgi:hypothetical protein
MKEWTTLFDLANITLEEVVGLQSFGNILVLARHNRDGRPRD